MVSKDIYVDYLLINEEESRECTATPCTRGLASGERCLFLTTSSAAITNHIISKVLASSRFGRRYQRGAVNRLMQLDESPRGAAHLSPL